MFDVVVFVAPVAARLPARRAGGGGERQYQQLNPEREWERGREAAIGFSLMLIERVTAVGDSRSQSRGVSTQVGEGRVRNCGTAKEGVS